MNIEIKNSNYTTQEKLQILADAAKYDVACTSSGSSRRGKKGELGNTEACGICHSFAADGRCIPGAPKNKAYAYQRLAGGTGSLEVLMNKGSGQK